MSERRFEPTCPEGCTAYGEHFHKDDWNDYWGSLTPEQVGFLKHKANWEHMSVSAVAMEWGVEE